MADMQVNDDDDDVMNADVTDDSAKPPPAAAAAAAFSIAVGESTHQSDLNVKPGACFVIII